MTKRLIAIDDLYNLKFLNEPQISPDGKRVLYSVQTIDAEKNCYRSHLWIADIETGESRPFTHGAVYDSRARWSPDGKRVAFLRACRGPAHLWVMAADGGEARQLNALGEGRIGTPRWSPNSVHVAFTFRPTHPNRTADAQKARAKRGLSEPPRVHVRRSYRAEDVGYLDLYQHIGLCDADTGQTALLTHGAFDADHITWSPDGKWLAFLANCCEDPHAEPYRANLYLVPFGGGDPVEAVLPFGYKSNLAWSPDGKHIAFIGYETTEDSWGAPLDKVWVIPISPPHAGTPRCLTTHLDRFTGLATLSDVSEVDQASQSPVWLPDSMSVLFPVSDSGRTHLYRAMIDGKQAPEPVVDGDLDVKAFSLDGRGEVLSLLVSRPTQPAELLYACKSAWDRLLPLTNLNGPWLDSVVLSDPEEFRIESFDGQLIQGWVLRPPDFSPENTYPVLLYIHGGPHAQYGCTFFHEFQVLAAQNIVVVYANPRGSLGVGAEFARSIQGDWGGLDYQDLMAVADYAAALPYTDPERMAVAGGSYGGYMTAWIIGHNNRFCCAIADRGSYNRHSHAGTSDWPPMPEGYWSGNAWACPERLWEQSPLHYAQAIHTPLLILHCDGDLRCPIEQAEQLFSALTWLKREVVFVRYPREANHGLSRSGPPDLRIDRLQRIVGWLANYVGGLERSGR